MMVLLYVLCGIPGSGKTTLSTQLAERFSAKLYCYDSLPGANHPKYHHETRQKMMVDIAEDLKCGLSVVCDDCHVTEAQRSEVLSAVSEIQCKKTLIVMVTPFEECLLRNANREARLPDFILYDLKRRYQPPTLDEGWDEIICVGGGKP